MAVLEQAPAIEIRETPEDDLDIPDMQSHLYWFHQPGDIRVTHCGITIDQDPHVRMHRAEGDNNPCVFEQGQTNCPRCGAPICPVCLSLSKKSRR